MLDLLSHLPAITPLASSILWNVNRLSFGVRLQLRISAGFKKLVCSRSFGLAHFEHEQCVFDRGARGCIVEHAPRV